MKKTRFIFNWAGGLGVILALLFISVPRTAEGLYCDGTGGYTGGYTGGDVPPVYEENENSSNASPVLEPLPASEPTLVPEQPQQPEPAPAGSPATGESPAPQGSPSPAPATGATGQRSIEQAVVPAISEQEVIASFINGKYEYLGGNLYFDRSRGELHEVTIDKATGEIVDRVYSNFSMGSTPIAAADIATLYISGRRVSTLKDFTTGLLSFDFDVTELRYKIMDTEVYSPKPDGSLSQTPSKYLLLSATSPKSHTAQLNVDQGIFNPGSINLGTVRNFVDDRENYATCKDKDGNVFSTATGLLKIDAQGNQYEWVQEGDKYVGFIKTKTDGTVELFKITDHKPYIGQSPSATAFLTLKDRSSLRELVKLIGKECYLFKDEYFWKDVNSSRWFFSTESSGTVNAIFEFDAENQLVNYIYKDLTNQKIVAGSRKNDGTFEVVEIKDVNLINAIRTAMGESTPLSSIADIDLKTLSLKKTIEGGLRLVMDGNKFIHFQGGQVSYVGYVKRDPDNGDYLILRDSNGTTLLAYGSLSMLGLQPIDFTRFEFALATESTPAKLTVYDNDGKITGVFELNQDSKLLVQSSGGDITPSDEAIKVMESILGNDLSGLNWIAKIDANTFVAEKDGIYYRITLPSGGGEAVVYKFTQTTIERAKYTIKTIPEVSATLLEDFTTVLTLDSSNPLLFGTDYVQRLATAKEITAVPGGLQFKFDNYADLLDLTKLSTLVDLGTINSVTLYADNNWIIDGSKGDLRIYYDGANWKGIALIGDELRFWKDLTLESGTLNSADNLIKVIGKEVVDLLGRDINSLSINFDTKTVIKQTDEDGYALTVYRLKPGALPRGQKEPVAGEYRAAEKICDIKVPSGTLVEIDFGSGGKINSDFDVLKGLFGLPTGTDFSPQALSIIASRIYGIKSNPGAAVSKQLIIRNSSNNGYKIIDLKNPASTGGAYTIEQNAKTMDILDTSIRTVITSLQSDMPLGTNESMLKVEDIEDLLLSDKVYFDTANNRIMVQADTKIVGETEQRSGYQYRVFDATNGTEITADLSLNERLTPMGKAFEHMNEVLRLFGYIRYDNWANFTQQYSTGVVSVEVASFTGNNDNITFVFDKNINRITRIVVNPQFQMATDSQTGQPTQRLSGFDADLTLRWNTDGTKADISGQWKDKVYDRVTWNIGRGSILEISGDFAHIKLNGDYQGHKYMLDMVLKDNILTRAEEYNFSTKVIDGWASSKKTTEKFIRTEDGWKVAEGPDSIVEVFSDGTFTRTITYEVNAEGKSLRRHIVETKGGQKVGGRDETIIEEGRGDFLAYRNGTQTEIRVRIEGNAYILDDGKTVELDGVVTRTFTLKQTKDAQGNVINTKYDVDKYDLPSDPQQLLAYYREAITKQLAGLNPRQDEIEALAQAFVSGGWNAAVAKFRELIAQSPAETQQAMQQQRKLEDGSVMTIQQYYENVLKRISEGKTAYYLHDSSHLLGISDPLEQSQKSQNPRQNPAALSQGVGSGSGSSGTGNGKSPKEPSNNVPPYTINTGVKTGINNELSNYKKILSAKGLEEALKHLEEQGWLPKSSKKHINKLAAFKNQRVARSYRLKQAVVNKIKDKIKAYKEGKISKEELTAYLKKLGFSEEKINEIIEADDKDIVKKAQALLLEEYGVSEDEINKFLAGELSLEELAKKYEIPAKGIEKITSLDADEARSLMFDRAVDENGKEILSEENPIFKEILDILEATEFSSEKYNMIAGILEEEFEFSEEEIKALIGDDPDRIMQSELYRYNTQQAAKDYLVNEVGLPEFTAELITTGKAEGLDGLITQIQDKVSELLGGKITKEEWEAKKDKLIDRTMKALFSGELTPEADVGGIVKKIVDEIGFEFAKEDEKAVPADEIKDKINIGDNPPGREEDKEGNPPSPTQQAVRKQSVGSAQGAWKGPSLDDILRLLDERYKVIRR